MTTLERHVRTLMELSRDGSSCSYNEENKKRFATAARYVAKKLAACIGLPPDSYDLRYNKAGIACSGEMTLHGEWIYVQFDIGTMSRSRGFMWRTCNGRKDYTGHTNRWMRYDELQNLKHVAQVMRAVRPQVTELPADGYGM